jgi:eukaryotic-like serine/threonine-protein kinase
MVCPQCNHTNPDALVQCEKCSTPLPFSNETLDTGSQGWSAPAGDVVVPGAFGSLSAGTILGTRYKITRLLGQGGMGAVYQAYDRELDRQVALKVIRGDMAANPEILRRFKQELILARQITHKNVIRIFDLGQADGIKFITMDYIEGEDLQSVLRRKKKLEPAEAANIISQVCRALEAAHAEGVIHRDLKPQNIMLDNSGRAYVMDFGIARSVLESGMTQTGALIGTPDYMSPEQASGLSLDVRSDLFSVGIIFYELLSGQIPFLADTTMAKLWKRTKEPARPLDELDKTVPKPLSDIVRKCLEIEPEKRFASATELLQEIEIWQGPQAGTRVIIHKPTGLPSYVKWGGAGLGILLLAAGFFLRSRLIPNPVVPHAPVTLLIADFDNKTGDAVFDGTLEPMLGIALEGAPFISSYNRGQAKRVALRLQPGATHLDAELARLVAVREGVNAVLAGSITQDGGGYKVYVTTLDASTGKSIIQEQRDASSKQGVLGATEKLAERIRKGLGDTTPESAQQSTAETFTAGSLEAAHSYATAQDLQQKGKWDEAIKEYQRATELDPAFGRAYAGLAATEANIGKRSEAEKNYQQAMVHIDRMTEREKYRTRGGYYLLIRDQQKAIDEYTRLIQQFPADSVGYSNLALAYFYSRNMAKAQEIGRHSADLNPASVAQRGNLALYALYAGDFANAAKEAQAALKLNPKYEPSVRALALAELGQGQDDQAAETYQKLAAISARGASMAATGLADLALYEGRIKDAINVLEKGIAADLGAKDSAAAGGKMAMLAEAQLALGQKGPATASAEKAISASPDDGVGFLAARVFIEAGQPARAKTIAADLSKRLEPEPQAYAKLIEGESELKLGDARGAIKSFMDGQKLADTWLGHFDLGRASLKAGAFPQASSEFDACHQRRGEASSIFLDDEPSYRVFPEVLYYLGQAQEGLHSAGAADSYKAFLAVKAKGVDDPLIKDARRRLSPD